jgi:hypothetical protein
MTELPRKAPIAHFHGPLTVDFVRPGAKLPPDLAFVPGAKPVDLEAVVGTVTADHGGWVYVRSHQGSSSAFPRGICPVVDVEFPPRVAGGMPIKERYRLDQFC